MNLPFQIYDLVSTLFPGFLALILIRLEYPNLIVFEIDDIYLKYGMILIFAYLVGSFIQNIARIKLLIDIYEKITSWKKNKEEPHLVGRYSYQPISETLQKEFEKSFYNLYGVKPNFLEKNEVFNMMYSTVYDRMFRRDMFLATANFLRAIALISFFSIIYFIIKSIIVLLHPGLTLNIINSLTVCFILVVSLISFNHGYRYFRRIVDLIPFYTFISWVNEKKFEKQ